MVLLTYLLFSSCSYCISVAIFVVLISQLNFTFCYVDSPAVFTPCIQESKEGNYVSVGVYVKKNDLVY